MKLDEGNIKNKIVSLWEILPQASPFYEDREFVKQFLIQRYNLNNFDVYYDLVKMPNWIQMLCMNAMYKKYKKDNENYTV